MAKIYDCISASSQITSLHKTDTNQIIFSTLSDGVKVFNAENYVITDQFSNQFLDENVTATTFNKAGNTMAYATKKAIYVADLRKKEIIKLIPIDSEIQTMAFEHNYIFAAHKNGRVYQYSYLDSTALSRLCSFKHTSSEINYATSICCSKEKIALGGLDGSLVVINLFSHTNREVHNSSNYTINSLLFVGDHILVSGGDDGVINIYSDQELTKSIQTTFEEITHILALDDTRFLLICSQNYLGIFDTKEYKMIKNKVVEFEDDITFIEKLNDQNIFVTLKNKEIKKLVLPDESELRSLIVHNSLDQAYELVEKESMLSYTKTYKQLEEIYKNAYKKALIALNANNESLAKEILSMYMHTNSKREQIASLIRSFKHLDELQSMYKNEKTSLCYALVSKYPELENTAVFRKLEQIWRDDFKSAQIDMLKADTSSAESTLQKYKTVSSKKEMVQLILKQNEKFKKFLLALDERNFFKAHEIARENTILQRIPTYEKLKNELEFKLEQIELFLHSGDTKKAKETINVIQNIPYLKDKIEFFLDKCVQVELLNSHYEKNDFKACYETLDKHQYLQKTQLAQLLKKHWESLIQKCEYFALKGNVLAVKKTLGELVTLRSRVSKIGDLFRLAFHVKIKESLSLRNFKDVEKLIYRYSDLFGVDIEIKELMKKYEQKTQNKLALTQDSNITRDSWIDSNFVK